MTDKLKGWIVEIVLPVLLGAILITELGIWQVVLLRILVVSTPPAVSYQAIPVGNAGDVLVIDCGSPTGVRWAKP